MATIEAMELAWSYVLINACIAAGHIRRAPSTVPLVPGPPVLPAGAPGTLALGLPIVPLGGQTTTKCFLGGQRDINAGFLAETVNNHAVLAFRGTLSPGDTDDTLAICLDWTQDRLFARRPWKVANQPFGNVATGFSTAVEALVGHIELELMNPNNPWKNKSGLWITGHSKGGAMAALAASRIRKLFADKPDGFVRVVTFAAPMVADETFAAKYRESGLADNHWRYQFEHDTVPKLPSKDVKGIPFFQGCRAFEDDMEAVTGFVPLGEHRYIFEPSRGRYKFLVGNEADGPYEASLTGDLLQGAAAHNPNYGYLNCFRLCDDDTPG